MVIAKAASIGAQARAKLLAWYKEWCSRQEGSLGGQKPDNNAFFPVDLSALSQLLLPDWKVIDNEDLYHIDVSTPISGKAEFSKKIIYLDKIANGPRIRWTLAHELGHVFLGHSGCRLRVDPGPRSILRPDQLEPPSEKDAKLEREANAFAVELLMPEVTVRREFRRRFGADRLWTKSAEAQLILSTIYNRASDAANYLVTSTYPTEKRSLADFFGVSATTMRFRLLELGLVH
jgi:Zn-dependent peptidase ImmA (M78 family)